MAGPRGAAAPQPASCVCLAATWEDSASCACLRGGWRPEVVRVPRGAHGGAAWSAPPPHGAHAHGGGSAPARAAGGALRLLLTGAAGLLLGAMFRNGAPGARSLAGWWADRQREAAVRRAARAGAAAGAAAAAASAAVAASQPPGSPLVSPRGGGDGGPRYSSFGMESPLSSPRVSSWTGVEPPSPSGRRRESVALDAALASARDDAARARGAAENAAAVRAAAAEQAAAVRAAAAARAAADRADMGRRSVTRPASGGWELPAQPAWSGAAPPPPHTWGVPPSPEEVFIPAAPPTPADAAYYTKPLPPVALPSPAAGAPRGSRTPYGVRY